MSGAFVALLAVAFVAYAAAAVGVADDASLVASAAVVAAVVVVEQLCSVYSMLVGTRRVPTTPARFQDHCSQRQPMQRPALCCM